MPNIPYIHEIIFSVGGLLGMFIVLLVYLNIRNYLRSKMAYNAEKALRNNNLRFFRMIIDMMEPLKSSYPNYVYLNISSKVFFILNMIKDNESLEFQNEYLKILHGRLYESIARIRENYYDVASIIAPLNNLIKELNKRK